jgi:hypothetical protein
LGNLDHKIGGGNKNLDNESQLMVIGEKNCNYQGINYHGDQQLLEFNENTSDIQEMIDLESQRGDNNILGSMPSHLYAQSSSNVSIFGFIPDNAIHAVQGPVSNASPAALWGKRVKNEMEKYHNFMSYRIPVHSGIRVEKFKQMAGDYWDQELFDLVRF